MAKKTEYNLSVRETVEMALHLSEAYGGNLTLRQLYYRLVALGHETNSDAVYKRLGSIVTKARYQGDIPPWVLMDRNRDVEEGSYGRDDVAQHTSDIANEVEEAIRELPRIYIQRSLWHGQPAFVSVWVEKAALAGVFEPVCRELGVSWFACRGYPSVSSLWSWLGQWNEAHQVSGCRDAVILYFGDHDPDGLQIPKSALDSIEELRSCYHGDKLTDDQAEDFPESHEGMDDLGELTLVRHALTVDQIQTYSPPPFPAKMTSSRYKGYVADTGMTDAWELDALEPRRLTTLIRAAVAPYFDGSISAGNDLAVRKKRDALRIELSQRGINVH